MKLRRPDAGRHKAVGLVQLRRPALRALVELIEVSAPLVDGARQRVGNRSKELARVVAQRDQQAVVDGQAGIVDGVDRAEVGIEEAVDRAVVWRGVGLSIGQGHGRGGEGSGGEDRLLVGRNQVEVESEIAIGLAGDTVGISQQPKTVAVDVSDTERGLAAELVFHSGIGLLDVGATEIRRKNDDGGSAARAAGKR